MLQNFVRHLSNNTKKYQELLKEKKNSNSKIKFQKKKKEKTREGPKEKVAQRGKRNETKDL